MFKAIQKKEACFQFLYILLGVSLFLLPLIHAWMLFPLGIENINTRYAALGGIFPYSDANVYYYGANHLLDTGVLDPWNTRRPLNAILFYIRLWLANGNFQAALIVQALLCGISCLMVTKSITRTFGRISGLATLFILFLFAAVFIPTTLSETLGLTLGCLAFVILWAAIQTQKSALFFNAGLLLMVGLNARAGAFLILPLLILWLGYYFRNKSAHRAFNLKIQTIFTLGLLCGLIFNFVLIKLYSDPANSGGALHGNFALTVYGLASGGKLWNYAYSVFPNIASKSEAELAKFLYIQSFEQFKHDPTLLLIGLLKSWGAIFKIPYVFFQSSLPLLLKFFIGVLGFFTLIFSVWRSIKLYKIYKTEIGLIGIALLGMFLSAAVIWADGGFRVFAVTIPFFAVAFGIILGARLTSSPTQPTPIYWETTCAYALSYTLLILALIVPLFIKTINANEITPHYSCAPNETAIVTRNISGAPYIDLSEKLEPFKKIITRTEFEDKQSFLKILEPSILKNTAALGLVYNSQSKRNIFIIAPLHIFSNSHKWTGLCATAIPGIEDTILQIKSFGALSEK